MKNHKRIPFLLLTLALLCMSLTVSAFAAEAPIFLDVTEESPWYESVTYAAEQGITSGTGNGYFSPDLAMTARQWAVMVCRAEDKQPNEQYDAGFGTAELRLAFDEGWLYMYVMTEPDVRMCRGALYESAFRVYDIPMYSYELYENGATMGTAENCVRIAKELGICAEEATANDIMTRGETVQLLYLLGTQEYQVSEPPIMSELDIQNPDGMDINKFLLELEDIPQEIRDKYQAVGWKYIIDCEAVSQYAQQLNVSCIGVCDYAKKSIYVSESSATIHEFGHFLHRMLGFPASFDAIYQKEAGHARILLREYSLTTSKEYFADCFRYWIWHQQNENMLGQLQEVAPETYAFFSSLAANGWTR